MATKSATILFKDRQEMLKDLADDVANGRADIQRDNQGQVVVYSCVFEWSDGTYRDEPEKSDEDE